jgi:hypothetical protein
MFNHADPTQPDVYEYLTRCVERFRRMLGSSGRKILFSLSEKADVESQFYRIHRHLDQKYTGCELLVVKIEEPSSDGTHGLRLLEQAGSHRLFGMSPTSKCGPLSFYSKFDDLIILRLLGSLPLSLAVAPDSMPPITPLNVT